MIVPEDRYIDLAILEALKAKNEGDYAVGAVVVKADRVVGAASNRSRRDNSPTAHAELLAIEQAARSIGSRHLLNADIYTTHELSDVRGSDSLGQDEGSYLWRTDSRSKKNTARKTVMQSSFGGRLISRVTK